MPRWVATLLAMVSTSAPVLAQPDPARDLRVFFEQLHAGTPAQIGGQALSHAVALADLYGGRDHAPVWTDGGPLAQQAPALLAAIRQSEAHGLNPSDYHEATLARSIEGGVRIVDLAFELLASDALLAQAEHRSRGVLAPRDVDREWNLAGPEIDLAAILRQAMAPGGSVLKALDDLWPRHPEYLALVGERARLLQAGPSEQVIVPDGPLLKPGHRDPRVVLLKQRLLGPGELGPEFDPALEQAVIAFQRDAGVEPDGIVGPATLEVLNTTRAAKIARLDANLERWRWLPRTLPETYIRVNIASFVLRVIEDGREVLTMDAIVGRPYRRTPIFSESIRYLVFNPYWNVPFRLAVEDKLPLLKKDPAQLAALGYEVRPTGADAFVAVDTVDWSAVTRRNFHYLLRQQPGPLNALGRIKFMLPNVHDVYLHDTPERELFARRERGFSSGCVRLSDAPGLAQWILNHDGRPQEAARVAQLAAGDQSTTIYLARPVPVYLVYFTAFTEPSGAVVFRRDIYQRDDVIVAGLRGEKPS